MCGCANLYIVMVDIVSVQMRKCVCKSEDAWTSSPALGPPLSMHPGRLQSAQMCLLEPTRLRLLSLVAKQSADPRVWMLMPLG